MHTKTVSGQHLQSSAPPPSLRRVRDEYSRVVAIAIWPAAIASACLAYFFSAIPLLVIVGSVFGSAALGTFAWMFHSEKVQCRWAMALSLSTALLLLTHVTTGHPVQITALISVPLLLFGIAGWICLRTLVLVAIAIICHHSIAFIAFHETLPWLPASDLTPYILIGAIAIQAIALYAAVSFIQGVVHSANSFAQLATDSMTALEELSGKQQAGDAREKGRRAILQKMIAEFDNEFFDALDSVLQNLGLLKVTASNLSEIANCTNSEVKEAAATSDRSSESITTVAGAVQQLSQSISAINNQLSSTNELASEIEFNAQGTNKAVDSFDITIHRIDDIVGLIQNIASKINLLALNATIEAARAGEAGRGFAVVATEVKGLANQTALATKDVANLISEIKTAAALAFDSARNLSTGARDMNKRTISIAISVQEQDRATQTIHSNIAGVAAVVQSMAAITDNVSHSVGGTLKIANDVLASTNSIQNQATGLETSIHKLLQRIASA